MVLQPENLHDAGVAAVACGPRRELRLELSVLERGEGPVLNQRPAKLRFGSIDNYQAVTQFVETLAHEGDSWVDTIDSLKKSADGWILALDHAGDCEIRTTKDPQLEWS